MLASNVVKENSSNIEFEQVKCIIMVFAVIS